LAPPLCCDCCDICSTLPIACRASITHCASAMLDAKSAAMPSRITAGRNNGRITIPSIVGVRRRSPRTPAISAPESAATARGEAAALASGEAAAGAHRFELLLALSTHHAGAAVLLELAHAFEARTLAPG